MDVLNFRTMTAKDFLIEICQKNVRKHQFQVLNILKWQTNNLCINYVIIRLLFKWANVKHLRSIVKFCNIVAKNIDNLTHFIAGYKYAELDFGAKVYQYQISYLMLLLQFLHRDSQNRLSILEMMKSSQVFYTFELVQI